MKPTLMDDLELQKRCHDAGYEYVQAMHAGSESDLERKHLIVNACAAGYSKGWRDAMEEKKCDEIIERKSNE